MKNRAVDIQYRMDMDMLKRSLMGVFMYAVLLPVVFWPFNFHQIQPKLSFTFAALMLGVSLLRVVHKLQTKALYRLSPDLWRSLFALLSLSHAVVLSVYFAFSIYDDRFMPLLNVTMLIMGGVASSAVVALTPWGKFALTNLFVLLFPSVVVALTKDMYPLAATIALYMLFISFIGVRSSKEYRRAFDIEQELHAQKQELAERNRLDGLTGIFNRGHFNSEISSFWKRASREKTRGTLLMIDIDHFKSINDTRGHLYGDECIVHVAELIKSIARRDTDVVARYGGEEYAVLLTGCALEEAETMAEAIRAKVASSPFEFEGRQLDITVSIGVASYIPTFDSTANTLIQLADDALYKAKNNGRNQVCIDEGSV